MSHLGQDTAGGYGIRARDILPGPDLGGAARFMLRCGRRLFNDLMDTHSTSTLSEFYAALIILERALEGDNGEGVKDEGEARGAGGGDGAEGDFPCSPA